MNAKLYRTRSSKVANESQTMKKKPDKILCEYRLLEADIILNGFPIENFKENNRGQGVQMKAENVALSEINADLWDRALVTAIGDISIISYPHVSVVQKLVNYTLNSHFVDVGMITCFFCKLILFHPPKHTDMQNYYWSVLNDYNKLNPAKEEEKNLFWYLIEVLIMCLGNEECLKGIIKTSCQNVFNSNERETMEHVMNLNKKMPRNKRCLTPSPGKKEKICFESLPQADQLQRVLIVLEFLYNVIEIDFMHKLKENNFLSVKEFHFLSALIWTNVEDVGLMNDKVRKLIYVWFVMEQANCCHIFPIHKKLLTLLSEIIRNSEATEDVYLFLGDKTDAFAYELSLKFNNCLKENMSAVRMLKPHWLRMLLCCKLLSRITGKACLPELMAVHDILEYVVKGRGKGHVRIRKKLKGKSMANQKRSDVIKSGECYCMWGLDETKRAKMSVEVNCKSYGSEGWTALHEAVLNGHETCVEQLLKEDKKKSVDLGEKGVNGFTPLMCAVVRGHVGICRILLQHSGRKLLTDVDAYGRTVMDLCHSKDVSDVLSSFESNFSINAGDVEIVVDLCVQLVESYFITHRTWDLWKCRDQMRKKQEKSPKRWDRVRYETDVHTNIDKLARLVSSLRELKELTRFAEPLRRVLSLKNCL